MTLIEVIDKGYIELNPEGICVHTSPGLSFLYNRSLAQIKGMLEFRGWKWQYIIPYTSEALHGKTKVTLPKSSKDSRVT